MTDPERGQGAPPRHVHIEKTSKKTNWLPWALLGLGLLALIVALSRCNGEKERAVVTPAPTASPAEVVATTPDADTSTVLAGTSGLGGYLAGTEAAPRTFQFEKLNFDTAKSDIRPVDADEVNAIAAVLKQYGTARVRIAGYADARGPSTANLALGKARADSVKAALVAKGIDGARIETISGGENDPVDTNATASGQAENRRTELVVIAR